MNLDFDPRCPWHKVCRCTHTGCVKGWLPDQPGLTEKGNESDAVVKRCPICNAARKGLPYIPGRDVPALVAGERFDDRWENVK
jgi:hypothetical protein